MILCIFCTDRRIASVKPNVCRRTYRCKRTTSLGIRCIASQCVRYMSLQNNYNKLIIYFHVCLFTLFWTINNEALQVWGSRWPRTLSYPNLKSKLSMRSSHLSRGGGRNGSKPKFLTYTFLFSSQITANFTFRRHITCICILRQVVDIDYCHQLFITFCQSDFCPNQHPHPTKD